MKIPLINWILGRTEPAAVVEAETQTEIDERQLRFANGALEDLRALRTEIDHIVPTTDQKDPPIPERFISTIEGIIAKLRAARRENGDINLIYPTNTQGESQEFGLSIAALWRRLRNPTLRQQQGIDRAISELGTLGVGHLRSIVLTDLAKAIGFLENAERAETEIIAIDREVLALQKRFYEAHPGMQ